MGLSLLRAVGIGLHRGQRSEDRRKGLLIAVCGRHVWWKSAQKGWAESAVRDSTRPSSGI